MDTTLSNIDEVSGSGNVSMNIEAKIVTVNVQTVVNKPITSAQNAQASATASESSQQIKHCCDNIDRKGNKLCEVFNKKLRQFYSALALPKVAWLKKGHDLSIAEHFIQLKINESDESIEIEDIFKSGDNQQPNRILVEGQPGFGKTTLATKLAYDWAMNKEYINFKFTFFIPLRELLQRSIEDVIVEIADHIGFKDDTSIIEMINYHEKDTLFILDGLDEVSVDKLQETVKLLYKQIYEDATALVFCRTGLFELRVEERTQLFGIRNKRDFFDKKISTLGVKSEAAKRQFLTKFIPEATVDDTIKVLSSQIDLFNSPLFLMLIPVILDHDRTIGQFKTKTEFYKKIFNSVLKHSYVKRGLEIDNEFNMFCYANTPGIIQKNMVEFGMLCAQKILKNELKFDCDHLTQEVYELGFLIHHSEMTFFKDSGTHYEAFHLSILEFAAAFGLWMNFKSDKSANKENDLKLIVNHYLATSGTSLILPFLANLMGDDLDYLLCQFELYGHLLSLKFHWTANLVADCSTHSIINSKYLKRFIPCHVSSYYHTRDDLRAYKELLQHGIECGKINIIEFETSASLGLVSNETKICLQLNLLTGYGKSFTAYSYTNCKIFSSPVPFGGTLNECLNFVASSSDIESCSVNWSLGSSEPFLQAATTDKRFNKIKYRYLHVKLQTEFDKGVVLNLLENNQVQHLELRGSFNLNMSQICHAAAHSSDLTRLGIADCFINLNTLIDNGTKKYKRLELDQCMFVSQQGILNRYGLYILSPNEAIPREEPVFRMVCDAAELKSLTTNYPGWVGFNRIKSAKIRIPHDSAQVDFFHLNELSGFKNLQILHLKFTSKPHNEEIIAKCINKLSIVKLVVENSSSDGLDLFKCMNDLWVKERNVHLKTVHFNCYGEFVSEPLELLKGLENNHWDKVNFLANESCLWDISKHLTNFDIIYYHSYNEIEQSDSVDSDYDVRYYFKYCYEDIHCHNIYHVFSVTKNCQNAQTLLEPEGCDVFLNPICWF